MSGHTRHCHIGGQDLCGGPNLKAVGDHTGGGRTWLEKKKEKRKGCNRLLRIKGGTKKQQKKDTKVRVVDGCKLNGRKTTREERKWCRKKETSTKKKDGKRKKKEGREEYANQRMTNGREGGVGGDHTSKERVSILEKEKEVM